MTAQTHNPAGPVLPPCSFDPGAPIIVIGAGRSGSTLLVRILNAHPELSVKGETDFLLPRLWHAVWGNRFWHQWQHFTDTRPRAYAEYTPQIANHKYGEEEVQAAQLTARFMAALVKAQPERRYWGFKEIWNGSAAHHFSWDEYDLVFPRATWVHIVRHPLDFLGSALSWNRGDRSLPHVQRQLDDWADMVRYSRERAATGRFFEIRYEDLKHAPQYALAPLFESLKVGWHPACQAVLGQKVLDSHRDPQTEDVVFRLLHKSRELCELAREYAYHLEETRTDPVEAALRVEPGSAPSAEAVKATFGDWVRGSAVLAYLAGALGWLIATRQVSLGFTWRKVARTVLWPLLPAIRRLRRPATTAVPHPSAAPVERRVAA